MKELLVYLWQMPMDDFINLVGVFGAFAYLLCTYLLFHKKKS